MKTRLLAGFFVAGVARYVSLARGVSFIYVKEFVSEPRSTGLRGGLLAGGSHHHAGS